MTRHQIYDSVDLRTIVGDTGLTLDEWLDYWQFGNAEIWLSDGVINGDDGMQMKLCHELCHAAMLIDCLLSETK